MDGKSLLQWNLETDGFCLLIQAIGPQMLTTLQRTFSTDLLENESSVRARSSRGHVYAARNLIESIPEVSTVWTDPELLMFLHRNLGPRFGLVRALFFDKPPDRSWNLPWHKDTSIAVRDHPTDSAEFSRPTTKAGVPHLIASDAILKSMLTLRIHLDDVGDDNGPLQVIPESHRSSSDAGVGIENAVTIHARAGDVLAMRPLLSHASGSSDIGTTRHRRILHLEFAAGRELPGQVQWYHFVTPPDLGTRSAS